MNLVPFNLVAGLNIAITAAALPLATARAESPSVTASAAQTHRLGQHPTVLVQARQQAIDPNRFIVQPPASVTWRAAPEADPALRWAAPVAPVSPSAKDTNVASQGS